MLPSSNRLGCSERKVQLTSNLLYDFCISKCVQMCRREVEALLLAKLQQLVLHLISQFRPQTNFQSYWNFKLE